MKSTFLLVSVDWYIQFPPKLDSYRPENLVSVEKFALITWGREFSTHIDDFEHKTK